MNRRFVNLLVNKLCAPRPAFKLHCIDPAALFYPTGSPHAADRAAVDETAPAPGRLPSPTISFDWPGKRHDTGWMDFMAFKNNIIAVDYKGRTILYDIASRSVRAMEQMRSALRSKNISVNVGDSLYVMVSEAGLPSRPIWFHALLYGHPSDCFDRKDWYWRSLQLPRFAYADANYDSDIDYMDAADDTNFNASAHPSAICAFTVVGNSQIWISTVGAGTYTFDTVSGKWSKVGIWALPFRGHAVYVPEHSLWFGFSEKDNQLCAADLDQGQPVLQKLQKVSEDPPLPEAFFLTATRLLQLGSGKLCVARLFQKTAPDRLFPSVYRDVEDESFAVLTGVEVRRDACTGVLQMIKHKSTHYSFGKDDVKLL